MNATALVVLLLCLVVLPFALLAWSEAVGSAVLRAAEAMHDDHSRLRDQASRLNRKAEAADRPIRLHVEPPSRGERALSMAARMVAARRGLPAPAPRIEGGF